MRGGVGGEDCNLRAICQPGMRSQLRGLKPGDNGQQFPTPRHGKTSDI